MSKKLTQEEFASIFGISQQNVSRMEREKGDIPTDLLIQIAKYFHVSVDYILKISDERESLLDIAWREWEKFECMEAFQELNEDCRGCIGAWIMMMKKMHEKGEK